MQLRHINGEIVTKVNVLEISFPWNIVSSMKVLYSVLFSNMFYYRQPLCIYSFTAEFAVLLSRQVEYLYPNYFCLLPLFITLKLSVFSHLGRKMYPCLARATYLQIPVVLCAAIQLTICIFMHWSLLYSNLWWQSCITVLAAPWPEDFTSFSMIHPK